MAKRPCAGCGVVPVMRGYCGRCITRSPLKQAEQYRGRTRDKRVKAWYDSARWDAVRRGMLRDHPLCAGYDGADHGGKLVGATDIDHILPHRGDYGLFWRRSNWQTLCHECHSRKTAVEDGGFGRQPASGDARAAL